MVEVKLLGELVVPAEGDWWAVYAVDDNYGRPGSHDFRLARLPVMFWVYRKYEGCSDQADGWVSDPEWHGRGLRVAYGVNAGYILLGYERGWDEQTAVGWELKVVELGDRRQVARDASRNGAQKRRVARQSLSQDKPLNGVTARDLAERAGVHISTARKWLQRGLVPAGKLPITGSRWVIAPAEMVAAFEPQTASTGDAEACDPA